MAMYGIQEPSWWSVVLVLSLLAAYFRAVVVIEHIPPESRSPCSELLAHRLRDMDRHSHAA
jgi:hypothetical protein